MTLIDLTAPAARNLHLGTLPVAIIGAGPIGLAAAAQLHERGIDFIVYEAGESIATSMAAWGHTRLFSPWKHLVDPAARRLLLASGWTEPDESSLPTGSELIAHYLEPLAALDAIASRTPTAWARTASTRWDLEASPTSSATPCPTSSAPNVTVSPASTRPSSERDTPRPTP